MHIIKSFGVLSVAKIMGAIYAVMGLLVMPIFLLIGMLGSLQPNQNGQHALGAVGGVILGLLAPFLYGAMGFIFGALGAFLYNFIAKWTGGIEVSVQSAGGQLSVG